MKKIYLVFTFILVFATVAFAQSESRLLKISNGDGAYELFEYNAEGQLTKLVSDLYGDGDTEVYEFVYTANEIKQNEVEADGTTRLLRTSQISNGRIVKEEISFDPNWFQTGRFRYGAILNFAYDASGHLVQVEEKSTGGVFRRYEFLWEDGNITLAKHYKDSVLVGEIQYSYDTSISNKYINAIFNPVNTCVEYDGLIARGQMFGEFYGVRSKNVVKKVEYKVYDIQSFYWDSDDNVEPVFIKDATDNIVRLEGVNNDDTGITLEWSSTTSGIYSSTINSFETTIYYNIHGVQIPRLQKGLNIIKTGGKTQKVLIR